MYIDSSISPTYILRLKIAPEPALVECLKVRSYEYISIRQTPGPSPYPACGQTYPVLPNPPAPLTLSASSSTTITSGVQI